MKKLVIVCALLMAFLATFSLVHFSYAVNFRSVERPQIQTTNRVYSADEEPSLQEFLTDYAINVTTDETGMETFPAGTYKMEILGEFADYAPLNNFSWYPASSGELHLFFYGANSTGNTTYITTEEVFGFSLGSPDGRFFTETWRNPDGQDHALVFRIPNSFGYIIAWEDLWNLGDKDYQDAVLAALIPVKTVEVEICPRTLNLKSQGRWITAEIEVPDGYTARDINVSSLLLNGTISADQVHFDEDSDELIVKFDRAAVITLMEGSLNKIRWNQSSAEISLTVTGKFLDGTPFQGTDTVRAIHFNDEHTRQSQGISFVRPNGPRANPH